MGESNIEDLILAEPENNKPKQKGILIILGLVVLLLVLGVVLANMIFGGSAENNATKQEVKQEEVKEVNRNSAALITPTNATEQKDEALDADLAPLDDEEANNVEVVKAQDQKEQLKKETDKKDNEELNVPNNQEAMQITKVNKDPKNTEPKRVVEHKPKPKPKPVTKPKPKPTHKTTYGGVGSVYIQVGSFSKGPNQDFINKIRRAGFKYKIVQAGPYRRVYVGPFRSTQEAKSVLGIVRSKISRNAFIKK